MSRYALSSCCTLSYVDSEAIAVKLFSVFEGRHAMSSVMQKNPYKNHVALPSPYLLHVLANNSYFHSQTKKLWVWVHAVFNNDQSGESESRAS